MLIGDPFHSSGSSCPFLAPFAPGQEDEAAGVEDGEEKIAQDNRQLIDVERVDQRDHASPEHGMICPVNS